MTDFNFRVRAVDNIGAFADRDFTIKVRNTQAENLAYLVNTDLHTTANGVSFAQRTGANGTGIVHGNGTWMIQVGDLTTNTHLYRLSTDGASWQTMQYSQNGLSPIPNSTASRPFFLNGNFVLGYTVNGSNFSHIAISSNAGMSWTVSMPPLGSSSMQDATAAFGNGIYVVARGTAIARSANLNNWTAVTTTNTPVTSQINHLIFVNGVFIMTDMANRLIITADFVNYTVRSIPVPANTFADRVYYGNGRLVVTLQRGSTTAAIDRVMSSDDGGLTWTARTFPNFLPSANAVAARSTAAFSNGGWYVGCNLANAGSGGLRFSRDLVNWTTVGNTNHAIMSGGVAGALR